MELGKVTGCHQMPERSFFIRNVQFPVCARCTGVFTGEILGFIFFKAYEISMFAALVLCGVMLFDWYIQFKKKCSSNNIRRFFTGFMCGYAFVNLLLKFLRLLSYFL